MTFSVQRESARLCLGLLAAGLLSVTVSSTTRADELFNPPSVEPVWGPDPTIMPIEDYACPDETVSPEQPTLHAWDPPISPIRWPINPIDPVWWPYPRIHPIGPFDPVDPICPVDPILPIRWLNSPISSINPA